MRRSSHLTLTIFAAVCVWLLPTTVALGMAWHVAFDHGTFDPHLPAHADAHLHRADAHSHADGHSHADADRGLEFLARALAHGHRCSAEAPEHDHSLLLLDAPSVSESPQRAAHDPFAVVAVGPRAGHDAIARVDRLRSPTPAALCGALASDVLRL